MKRKFALTPMASIMGLMFGGFCLVAHATVTPTVSGVVVGAGYYQNAKVCLDANNNGRCDAGEVSTTSDSQGHYTLPGSGAVAAQITTASTLFDPVTNTSSAVTRALTLRAPAQVNAVLSPLSTELQAAIDANGGDYDAAVAALATRVGVSQAQLVEDPNTETVAGVKTLLDTENAQLLDRIAYAVTEAGASGNLVKSLRNRLALDQIKNVVVIYLENRSFDNLFGAYPGANGLNTVAAKAIKQVDRDGSTVFAKLPPSFNGLTAAGQTPVVTQAQTVNAWVNAPFQIDAPATGVDGSGNAINQYGYAALPNTIITRDLYHRFFENQMQANGGKNNMFAAWGDSGGLVMGYFDGSKTQMWNLAKQYVLADNFYEGAWGGSFLNHQYLICACAPSVPASVVASNGMSLNTLTTAINGVPQLAANASQQASALNGAPSLKSGNIAPLDYFGAGDGYRAVNTMQPPFQPSGNKPLDNNGNDALYANPKAPTTLPAQVQTTIGDLLDAKGVDWAWYSGGWAAASANPYPYNSATNTFGSSTTIYNANSSGTSDAGHGDFQAHHQPFNYFAKFDPVSNAAYRAAHLKDRADLLADAQAGTLPAVAFYKPVGLQNQHPGYANVTDADAEVSALINAIQSGPQWNNTVVVITYDEFGGQFDHAAVPKGDKLGPGTRIPALVISPFAKKGIVDHTPYDTASILRLITHRYSLPVLDGLQKRDAALSSSIGRPMGDLTNALDFAQ